MNICHSILVLLNLVHLTTEEYMARCIMHDDADDTTDMYTWIKSLESPLDYQNGYCQMKCQGETIVRTKSIRSRDVECVKCYCQRPACEIYNNCCQDSIIPGPFERHLIETNSSTSTSEVPESEELSTPVLGCDLVDGQTDAYLYIRSCSSNYTEKKTMVDLCERDREEHEETIETFVRVVDLSTHVVYKNRFCAMCNKVVHFASLSTQLWNQRYTPFYRARNRDELLRLQLRENALVVVTFPKDVTQFDCVYSSRIVNSCNVSNGSSLIDEEVARACETLPGNNHQVFDTENEILYKNIFCAICGKRLYPTTYKECNCILNDMMYPPMPFVVTLDVKQLEKPKLEYTENQSQSSQCSTREWPMPHGNCVPLLCSAGKKLHNNQCTEILEEIKGLRYRLCLWMIPLYSDRQNIYNMDTMANQITSSMDNLITQMKLILNELSRDFNLVIYTVQSTNVETLNTYAVYWMDTYILAKTEFSRTQFESEILLKMANTNLSIDAINNESLVFQTYLMSPSLEENNNGIQKYTKKDNFRYINKTYHTTIFYQLNTEKTSINMSNILLCQYVRFDVTKYEMIIDYNFLPPNIRITIDLNATKINITNLKDFSMVEIDEDGGLNVCQDLLDSKLKAEKDNMQQDLLNRKLEETSLAEYIVSIMCCLASLVCLLMTLLTYFIFPVLRTEAGINNMFLSFSLLLAQISLLITSHISESSVMCTVIGITTHFLWLWMFSWSFICSYHMFRVFTANTTRPTSQNNLSGLCKKVVVSLLSPILIVCITILCKYFTCAGQEIGSGRLNCFLNSPLLIGVTCVGPISAVVVINGVFSFIIVYKIYFEGTSQLSSNSEDEQAHCHVYTSLSFVTVAFWIVATIAAAMDSEILKFISIIVNGLQGLAFILSFTCNKKVFNLYSELRKSKQLNVPVVTEA